MPNCFPAVPEFTSEAEAKVWRALVAELPERASIIANWERAERVEEYESDLIVVWPGKGIFLIEVKGGFISQDADGNWWSTDRHGERWSIDPFHQARRNAHAIERYVEQHWSQGRLHLPWLVVFPDTDLPSDFHTAEASRDRIIDRTTLPLLVDQLKAIGHDGAGSVATALRCEAFLQAMVDVRDPQTALIAADQQRSGHVQRLTEEQYERLEEMADNERFAILGPAGSGKTYLALEQAHRRAAAGERVAFVCYSYGLTQMVQRITQKWPEDERPQFVGTFHLLGALWGVSKPKEAPASWWTDDCARLMLEQAQTLEQHERFDTVIVDEAQDFKADWWAALKAAMHDPDHGGLFVFGDMDQNVFDRDEIKVLGLATARLRQNLRNARPIAELAGRLSSHKVTHLGLEGPAVGFEPCTADTAHTVADDVVEWLLDQGWAGTDIAYLSTKHQPTVQKEYTSADEEEAVRLKAEYWELFWKGDDVFFGTVTGFKGLERRVVVLAVDGFGSVGRERETLYAGMTRARDLLIVCGDPADIRRAGGEELLQALQAGGQLRR